MLTKISRPAIFAHRGASHFAPENTLAAFALALEQTADGLELDVMLTRDREVVVIHDNSVDRTTDGRGRVGDLNLAEIQQLDAGGYFGPEFSGQQVPTLAEVLQAFAGTIPINIELKNYATPLDELPRRAARLVQTANAEGQVLFSSFNPLALIQARRHLPEVPIGLLAVKGALEAPWMRLIRKLISHEALHPHHSDVTATGVARAHAQNRLVNVYTVNEEKIMLALFEMGIDGIFTDDPRLGLETRLIWRAGKS